MVDGLPASAAEGKPRSPAELDVGGDLDGTAGAVLKVTSPVVVSTDQPEGIVRSNRSGSLRSPVVAFG
jgi:hypothetical protein